MKTEYEELVSSQLRLPTGFSRSEDEGNRVTILTTCDWLTFVQSQGRLPNEDVLSGRISEDDRVRNLAPSTQLVPAPWIRVRVIVEPKSDAVVQVVVDSDAEESGPGETPFLNLASFVADSFYENVWRSFNGGDRPPRRRIVEKRRDDAVVAALEALYEPGEARDGVGVGLSEDPTASSISTTGGHPNIDPCYCVLDCRKAVLILQPYSPFSLFHAATYTQSLLTDNYAKSLFVSYQILRAMSFCHSRGLYLGDLRLDDVSVNEKLWVKIFPKSLEDTFVGGDNRRGNEGKSLCESGVDWKKPLNVLTQQWVEGLISNFDYLMLLNRLAGKVKGDPNNHPILPWVVDFLSPQNYRDLTKSKYRLNKGDHQLDLMYESQQLQIPVAHDVGNCFHQDFARTPHHISDMLSDITYYVYCARRIDKSTLCAHVRSNWVPNEYPSSMQRMYLWTPDECIPEFYTEPSIFTSIHEDLPNLDIPHWAESPEDFIVKHRQILDGPYVSRHLHHWINLTFGYMLSGQPAVSNKNVCLRLVDGHEEISAHGVVQLFTHPHPQKLVKEINQPSIIETNNLRVNIELNADDLSNCHIAISTPFTDTHTEDAIEASVESTEKKSSKSSKDESKRLSIDSKILLPEGFNPLAQLEGVEALYNFVSKSMHRTPQSDVCAIDNSDSISQSRVQRDMECFAVLMAEMILAKRLRFELGDKLLSWEERRQIVRTVFGERFTEIPRPFRRILKILLLEGSIESNFYGAPLTPYVLLHPLVDIIAFPAFFSELYSFIKKLHFFNDSHCSYSESTSNLANTESRNKVDLCAKVLPSLLPNLTGECQEILLPYLKDLFINPQTAVASAWHLFGIIATNFGPEKIIKDFLPSLVKLFQDEGSTSKHMKLYHRTFMLQMMVGLGLQTFLLSFSTLLVEATAGFKNFDDDFIETVEVEIKEIPDEILLRQETYSENEEENSIVRSASSQTKSDSSSSTDVFDRLDLGPVLETDSDCERNISDDDNESVTLTEPVKRFEVDIVDIDSCNLLGTSVHSISRVIDATSRRAREKVSDVSNGSICSNDNVESAGNLEDSLKSSGTGRSSGFSTEQCNISTVSSETIKWLTYRLGPVLTTKYISGNLLKMLSLCYLGSDQLQQPFGDREIAKLWYTVNGDFNAKNVLDCLSSIAVQYGEQIILLHYFPYLAELISSCSRKNRLNTRTEAGLVSAMVLLRHCLPLLADQTLMDYLPDVVFRDILNPTIQLISSPSLGFPSGALSRSVICFKLIDVMMMVSLRIGFEMTRKMMTTLLTKFFACFDNVHSSPGTEDSKEIIANYIDVDAHTGHFEKEKPSQSQFQSFADAKEVKHVRSSSLYSLSALNMESKESEVSEKEASPSEDEEQNKAELKKVFTSGLAHSVYVPFCKLAGNIHLDQTLTNKDLIHSLVAKVESSFANEAENLSADPRMTKAGSGTGSCNPSSVSGNFGKDVAVSGNRINLSSLGETATPPSPARPTLSPDLESRALVDLTSVDVGQLKSFDMQNGNRHLKGNWLQYWEHEIGLSAQDANSFEFKGIRLQSFVGHAGSVRSLWVLDNENSFLSASKDKTVKLWSIKNFGDGLGRTYSRWTYPHHKKSVFSVMFLNSLRLVASCDSTVHLWDPFIASVVHQYDANKLPPVSVLAPVPAPSSTLVAATTDSSLKLLDCRNPAAVNLPDLRVSLGSVGPIRCVAVSPDGSWVACGFSSGMIGVVDLRTGLILGMWKAHEGEVYKVEAFDRSTIVTSSFDQSIQVWDIHAKKRMTHLKGHMEPAHCLAFFKSMVLSATTSNRIGVHSNITANSSFAVSKLHTDVFKGVLTTMSILPLNRLLLLGADNGNIKLCLFIGGDEGITNSFSSAVKGTMDSSVDTYLIPDSNNTQIHNLVEDVNKLSMGEEGPSVQGTPNDGRTDERPLSARTRSRRKKQFAKSSCGGGNETPFRPAEVATPKRPNSARTRSHRQLLQNGDLTDGRPKSAGVASRNRRRKDVKDQLNSFDGASPRWPDTNPETGNQKQCKKTFNVAAGGRQNFRQRWGKPFKGRRRSSSKTEDETHSKPKTPSTADDDLNATPQQQQQSARSKSGRRRRRRSTKSDSEAYVVGSLEENLQPLMESFVKGLPTGLVFDSQMNQHRSHHRAFHVERPERIIAIYDKMCESGLASRCESIAARPVHDEEILSFHDETLLEKLKSAENRCEGDEESRSVFDALTASHEDVYFNASTAEAARLSAGACVDVVERVVDGSLKNGFAVVRPPGHHAMRSDFCGFCYLNNAVLAAKHAVDNLGCGKVLIVDWDVHHGQGTQYAFYDDPRVLYFSVHRYAFGSFWPHLRESDYDAIGEGEGLGFNVNVPLNKKGCTDADYLHIFFQILLPIAYEFCPELVIVSAGFDAALGDPLGEMRVTPSGFAQMIRLVKLFAEGKVVVLLEGGYNLTALSESAAATLSELLDDSPPRPQIGGMRPDPLVCDAVHNLKSVLRPYWQCFSKVNLFHSHRRPSSESASPPPPPLSRSQKHDLVQFKSYENPPRCYSPDYYDPQPEEEAASIEAAIAASVALHPRRRVAGTALVYDSAMKRHRNAVDPGHPEKPERIGVIYSELARWKLLARCHLVDSRLATEAELKLCHEEKHVSAMRSTKTSGGRELFKMQTDFNSVYLNQSSFDCARLSCGCLLNVVDDVMAGRRRNGAAIVRPPGHHAERHVACGFCLFNNVAVAARYAQARFAGVCRRVLIVDWDVHHGNGTQHIFQDDPSVLYISIHRHDDGGFFPCGDDGDFDRVGSRLGAGFNVNVPWNTNGRRSVGDATYLSAFLDVVMPVATQFDPDLVLVSAGFDAAMGDPLGKFQVTPMAYAHMTHMLCGLAEGRVVLALEGGYNLKSISECMTACVLTLLGCPPPRLAPHKRAMHGRDRQSIENVVSALEPFWPILNSRILAEESEAGISSPVDLNQNKKKEVDEELNDVFESLTLQSTPIPFVTKRESLDPDLKIKMAEFDLKLAEVPAVVSPEVQQEAKHLIRVLLLGQEGAKQYEESIVEEDVAVVEEKAPLPPLVFNLETPKVDVGSPGLKSDEITVVECD